MKDDFHNEQGASRCSKTVFAITVPVVAVFVYLGVYFALLESKVYRQVGFDPATGINRFEIEPAYRIGNDALSAFLSPAHRIDRDVWRVDYWHTIESSGRNWTNP